jgi:hypothetical protein
LLEGKTPSQRASRARLVVALDELTRAPWTSLQDYAVVRGIDHLGAARRSLFRLKDMLGAYGVSLEIRQTRRKIAGRFGTPEIAELIEPDVRVASRLVEQQQPESGDSETDDEASEGESVVISPETVRVEYRGRLKSFTWIARKHGVGKERLRRILVSTGPIAAPEVRRCVEERRPKAVVDEALAAADRGAHLDEVARILGCSKPTAASFLRRNGRMVARPGRPSALRPSPKNRDET